MEGRHLTLESIPRTFHICWKEDIDWRDLVMQHVQMICEYTIMIQSSELVVHSNNNYYVTLLEQT